jgi:hypothetical protein
LGTMGALDDGGSGSLAFSSSEPTPRSQHIGQAGRGRSSLSSKWSGPHPSRGIPATSGQPQDGERKR